MKLADCCNTRGRPREFDVDQALASALRVFWTKGYEAASLTDLTDAMGITKPSLYAAFGNKEQLFCKALDLYEVEKLAYMRGALEAPTARGVARNLLMGALEAQTSCTEPKGCMGVVTAVNCGAEAESIREEVVKRRASSQKAMVERFERAKQEGDLPATTDVDGLTSYLLAIMQGMSVQASAGANRDDLEKLVDTGLALWPSK